MNITDDYLLNDVPEQMRMHLSEQGTLLLYSFLERDSLALIESLLRKGSWKKEYIADKYSYEENTVDLSKAFNDGALLGFMKRVAGREVQLHSVVARRFRHRDYTLLHDALQEAPQTGVKFCYYLVEDEWNGEYGGMNVITHPNRAPAIIVPTHNAFCLITKDADTLDFVKYVNNRAGARKFVLIEGLFV